MVKHQRRSHQRGIHATEMDDSVSESASDGSPTTPKNQVDLVWPTQPLVEEQHQYQRAASFQFVPMAYPVQQDYSQRHSLPSGIHPAYHGRPQGSPHSQTALHQPEQPQPQQQPQHPAVHLIQRPASMPHHNYFMAEQNNPGVATMAPNPHAMAQHMQYQQMPRQVVERPSLDIPYSSAPGMAASIQSSPGSFSASPARSPSQDAFYTHAPPAQAQAYGLHSASPVDQQAQRHHQMVMAFQNQLPPSQATSVEAIMAQGAAGRSMQQQQRQHGPTAEEQHWYNVVEYQSPVEVAPVGQMPTYGQAVFDPWGIKMEYDDPSMQLPSARVATL